ncbi:hypothetical protein K491DRAFT_234874 [Lophiostoma macrostomum CBS 122681]|uniref:Uncharacterized protein n=1 Tax=Lophiostoma macrostomum CBS 122681 TaxID=1314788 RepID=A0A6A6TFR7_9PLEO|nr:hypothetical protein K491DRAFT_234874 [Lophiostoma macrostomum CBS 122681]
MSNLISRQIDRLTARPRRYFRALPVGYDLYNYNMPKFLSLIFLISSVMCSMILLYIFKNVTDVHDFASDPYICIFMALPLLFGGATHIYYETRRCYELHWQTLSVPRRTWSYSLSMVISNSVDMFIVGCFLHDLGMKGTGLAHYPHNFWVLGMIGSCAVWSAIVWSDWIVAKSRG